MNPTFSPRSLARPSSSRPPRSAPSRTTEPRDGVSRPASRPSRVVLPLPEGPMMETNAPWGMENETSRSTVSRCAPLSYSFVRSRAMSMIGRAWWGGVLGLGLACSSAPPDETDRPADDAGAVEDTLQGGGGEAERARSIVFFGTSLTAGLGVQPEEAYPALIDLKVVSD